MSGCWPSQEQLGKDVPGEGGGLCWGPGLLQEGARHGGAGARSVLFFNFSALP